MIAAFDRFINGDRKALSAEQQAGLQVFRGKGNCTACHVGPNFSDERLHNTGIAWQPSGGPGQEGRYLDDGRFAVTGREADRGLFKAPTLREVARTSPYMHDGSTATLEDVSPSTTTAGGPTPISMPRFTRSSSPLRRSSRWSPFYDPCLDNCASVVDCSGASAHALQGNHEANLMTLQFSRHAVSCAGFEAGDIRAGGAPPQASYPDRSARGSAARSHRSPRQLPGPRLRARAE